MRHAGHLVVARGLLVMACGTWFPDQDSSPGPLHREHVVPATGQPGDVSIPRFLNILQKSPVLPIPKRIICY